MTQKVLNGFDMNGTVINNLPDAVLPQQPATLSQLNAAVQGWKWKDPVRAATTANITLSGAQTIDGVSVVAGDRVLVKNQTTASANGIYVVSGAAWSRATDMDSSAEVLLATTLVSEGSLNGNTGWTMTTDGPIALGTTNLVYAQTIGAGTTYTSGTGINISSGVVSVDPAVVTRKAAATIGDGVATTYTVTHGLGTLDVQVTIREVATGSEVLVDNTANSTNTVQVTFATAPSSGQYRAIVQG